MKVKTYKTHSLHEGLEDIKRDLGSEALIISTRSVSVRPPYSLFKKPADRKSTRLNSSHIQKSRMPSSA